MTEAVARTGSNGEVSADDVRAVRFSKVIGRGYEQSEVDAFVDKCAAWIDWFSQQLKSAQHKIDDLEQNDGGARVQQAVQVLTNAQQTADTTVRQADQYSLRVMSEAKQLYQEARARVAALEQEAADKAGNLVEQAAGKATQTELESAGLAESVALTAQQQAAATLRDAQSKAEQLMTSARRQSAELDEENGIRLELISQAATVRQAELEEQTAYLQSLRDTSRAQMQTFLERLLNQLSDEYGRLDPVAAQVLLTGTAQTGRPTMTSPPSRRMVGRSKRTARKSYRSIPTGAAAPAGEVSAQ